MSVDDVIIGARVNQKVRVEENCVPTRGSEGAKGERRKSGKENVRSPATRAHLFWGVGQTRLATIVLSARPQCRHAPAATCCCLTEQERRDLPTSIGSLLGGRSAWTAGGLYRKNPLCKVQSFNRKLSPLVKTKRSLEEKKWLSRAEM